MCKPIMLSTLPNVNQIKYENELANFLYLSLCIVDCGVGQ